MSFLMESSVKQTQALFDTYLTQFKDGEKLAGMLKHGSTFRKTRELATLVQKALDRGAMITDAELRSFMRGPGTHSPRTKTN